jgi:hypothetical protein
LQFCYQTPVRCHTLTGASGASTSRAQVNPMLLLHNVINHVLEHCINKTFGQTNEWMNEDTDRHNQPYISARYAHRTKKAE